MVVFFTSINILSGIFLLTQVKQAHPQGSSISFSPNIPLCIGEEVEVLCFVETSEPFESSTASLSINSSSPITISQLTDDPITNFEDLPRYSADTDGLSISKSRAGIRLIIHSYQSSDSHTTFGCHGQFPNMSYSSAIEGSPSRTADPPSSPSLSTSLSTLSASECQGVSVSWLAPATDRNLTQYYLYRNSSLISTLSNTTTQYTDTDPLILNVAYQYSLAAASCAGNSTMSYSIIKIPAIGIQLHSPANITVLLNGTIGISVIPLPQLSYEITLYKNDVTSLNQTIAIIQDPTQSFSTVFSLDTCYYTGTRAKNCTHETDAILSRGFILYRLDISDTRTNVYFQSTTNHLTRFQFTRDAVANISCSNKDYESPFIPEELIVFHLIRKRVIIHNISNVTVISPFGYEFEIPEEYSGCDEDIFIRMAFKREIMSNKDVLFCTRMNSGPPTVNITPSIVGSVGGLTLVQKIFISLAAVIFPAVVLVVVILICICIWRLYLKCRDNS